MKYNMAREGVGSYTFLNKFFKYEGEWKRGRKNGRGKFIMKDGSIYEGEFTNDEIQGNGCYYNARTGDHYKGEFIMGEKSGKGLMKYNDGSIYEGDWDSNKRQGHGTLYEASGAIYEGEFYKHKKHGEGMEQYKDGSKYKGYWVAGNKHGHGKLDYKDGSSYEGQWMSGARHGIGVLKHISGFRYEGLWHCDSPTWMASKMCLAVGVDVGKFNYKKEFSLSVECFDADNRVCNLDNGRTIEIFAGKLVKTDPKDSSGRISNNEESDRNEMREFALNCFNINMMPIDIMRMTLTMQETSNKEPDLDLEPENRSQKSVQSKEDEEEEEEEADDDGDADNDDDAEKDPHSIKEFSASETQNEEEENLENIESKDQSCNELLKHSSGLVPAKLFYSAYQCISRTDCGRIAFDRLLIADANETKDEAQQHLEDDASAQNVPDNDDDDAQEALDAEIGSAAHGTFDVVEKTEDVPDVDRIVFIARDVTNPPFMGCNLSPCYVLVEVENDLSRAVPEDASEVKESLQPEMNT